jgi:hypothetical protein
VNLSVEGRIQSKRLPFDPSKASTHFQNMSKLSNYFDTSPKLVAIGDTSSGEYLQKHRILVENLPAPLFGGQNADSFQFLKIFGSRLPLGNPGLHKKLDLAIGLREDEFDEFLGIDLGWQLGAAASERLIE